MYEQIKVSLRTAYDRKVEEREKKVLEPWKIEERRFFLSLLQEEKKRTLLEIGSGTGANGLFFHEHGLEVICTDLSPAMVAHCRKKGLVAFAMDFLNLDFPTSSFEAVFAINCLLHVPRENFFEVLESVRDLLQPGGLNYLGQYGGIEYQGIVEEDHYEPKRFYSLMSDEQIFQAVSRVFKILYFKAIHLNDSKPDMHFQSMILRSG